MSDPFVVVNPPELGAPRGFAHGLIAPWVLPFATPEPDQVELFAERVMGPFRAGR